MTEIKIGCYKTPRGIGSACTIYFNCDLAVTEALEQAHNKIQNDHAHNRDYLLNCLALGNFQIAIN